MRERIESLVREALAAAVAAGELALPELPEVTVERPRDPGHGDWATNVAMQLAKPARMSPRAIADIVAARIAASEEISAVEVAGPGFINLRLSPAALQRTVAEIREQRADFGRADIGRGQRLQVEFVSANPVGPMHVGHGRWAALGDSIARILEHVGYEVEREFYINDAGVQMDVFAKSVAARYLELSGAEGVEFGEDWYRGAYIGDIAAEILAEEGDAWVHVAPEAREAHFREKAYAQVLEHLKRVLHDFGVDFDVWFSERTLHSAGEVERAIDVLRQGGHVYDKDGATWFASTGFGDDKDRVMRKADGEYTYFAADIAYHWNKFAERGFDRVIDIWGADHHGYVQRMQAATAALGYPERLEVIIGQLVNLFRAGEVVRMSKRTGEMVTFEDLVEDVGVDAARYFFLRRSTDQPLDFDIALAKERSADNPVYYVQYAHARICSILRKAATGAADSGMDADEAAGRVVPDAVDLSPLVEEAEAGLLRRMAEFGEVVEEAARRRAPHKLTRFAEDLATSFHQFYTVCRVIGEEDAVTAARLALVDATRVLLATTLGLVGVTAPQRM